MRTDAVGWAGLNPVIIGIQFREGISGVSLWWRRLINRHSSMLISLFNTTLLFCICFAHATIRVFRSLEHFWQWRFGKNWDIAGS